MEQAIHDAFTPELLSKACAFFNVEGEPQFIRYFENFVYDVQRDNVACILRVTHSSHRSTDEVLAELDWLNYLVEHGVTASRALPAKTGELVLKMDAAEGYFTAALFLKAKGVHAKEVELTSSHFLKLGQLIGQIQALTKQYKVPAHLPARKHWYEESYNDARKYLPAKDSEIVEMIEALMAKIKTWEISPENYGMIHGDAHPGNFFVEGENITLFDFDDVNLNFLVCDAVVVIESILRWKTEPENREVASLELQRQFWKGFDQYSFIDDLWIERIPDLMMMRIMGVYVILHAKLDQEKLTDDDAIFISDLREQILARKNHMSVYVKTRSQL